MIHALFCLVEQMQLLSNPNELKNNDLKLISELKTTMHNIKVEVQLDKDKQ